MKYSCPFAHYVDDEIMCKKTADFCGNVKFCRMSGKWELTDSAVKCPARFAEDKPAKKPRAKKVTK